MNIGDKVRHRNTGRTGTLRAKNYNRWASQFVEWDDGMTVWYHESVIEAAPEPSSTFKVGEHVALVQEFNGQAPEPLRAGAVGVVLEVKRMGRTDGSAVYVLDFPQREKTTRVAEVYLRAATVGDWITQMDPPPTELNGIAVGDRVQGKWSKRRGVVTAIAAASGGHEDRPWCFVVDWDRTRKQDRIASDALEPFHTTEPRRNGKSSTPPAIDWHKAIENIYAVVGVPTQYETKTVDAIKRLPKPELVNDLHETHVDLNGRRYCVTVERVS